MGAHRRWDCESLQAVVGLPWQRKPDDPREEADAQARWVDHVPGLVTDPEETEAPARRRLMLRREDFFKLGFTEGCAACRAIIHGHKCGAHSESCRSRMEKELRASEESRRRLERERQKLETSGARKREEEELTDNKRSKVAVTQRAVVEQGRASSSSTSSSDLVHESMDESCDKRRREETEPFQGVKPRDSEVKMRTWV